MFVSAERASTTSRMFRWIYLAMPWWSSRVSRGRENPRWPSERCMRRRSAATWNPCHHMPGGFSGREDRRPRVPETGACLLTLIPGLGIDPNLSAGLWPHRRLSRHGTRHLQSKSLGRRRADLWRTCGHLYPKHSMERPREHNPESVCSLGFPFLLRPQNGSAHVGRLSSRRQLA